VYQPVFERQVALIEVDTGRQTTAPPGDSSLKPGTTYDNDVVLPRAYLADVFRVRGGRIHTYNVHGPTEDEFEISASRGTLTADEALRLEADKHYVLKGEQWGTTIDADHFTATWRMAREPMSFTEPERGLRTTPAPELAILREAYDPNSPRKHLRVHLPGQKGQRATSGVWISAPNIHTGRTDGDWLRNLHVTRLAENPENGSLFAAVWEPYAGSPFVRDVRLEGTPDNAEGCVVLHVETIDGVRDALLFADKLPPEPHAIGADAAAQGHFAHISSDGEGLRHASLVAGSMIRFGKLTLRTERQFWEARTVAVDYLQNRATLENALPDRVLDGAFFEIGVPADGDQPSRWTTFEASRVSGRDLVWRKGAGCYSARMEFIRPTATGAVITVDPQPAFGPGRNAQLTTVNARGDRFWRCSVKQNKITLTGEPVTEDDFATGTRIYLYEIGPGDLWRTPTRISLRRTPIGFRLEANVPSSVEIASARAQRSDDAGMTWSDIQAGPADGVSTLSVSAQDLTRGSLLLRWEE
jgi:hypothetical protein